MEATNNLPCYAAPILWLSYKLTGVIVEEDDEEVCEWCGKPAVRLIRSADDDNSTYYACADIVNTINDRSGQAVISCDRTTFPAEDYRLTDENVAGIHLTCEWCDQVPAAMVTRRVDDEGLFYACRCAVDAINDWESRQPSSMLTSSSSSSPRIFQPPMALSCQGIPNAIYLQFADAELNAPCICTWCMNPASRLAAVRVGGPYTYRYYPVCDVMVRVISLLRSMASN